MLKAILIAQVVFKDKSSEASSVESLARLSRVERFFICNGARPICFLYQAKIRVHRVK